MSGSTLESRGDHVTKVKSWRFSASKRVENGAGCCWRMNCAIPFFIFLVIWVILFSEILKWVDQTVMEHNGEEKSVAATREANGRCIHYYLLHPHMPLKPFCFSAFLLSPFFGQTRCLSPSSTNDFFTRLYIPSLYYHFLCLTLIILLLPLLIIWRYDHSL